MIECRIQQANQPDFLIWIRLNQQAGHENQRTGTFLNFRLPTETT